MQYSITDANGNKSTIHGARPLDVLSSGTSKKIVIVQIEDYNEIWEVACEDVVHTLIRFLRSIDHNVVAWQVAEVDRYFRQACPTCGSQTTDINDKGPLYNS